MEALGEAQLLSIFFLSQSAPNPTDSTGQGLVSRPIYEKIITNEL